MPLIGICQCRRVAHRECLLRRLADSPQPIPVDGTPRTSKTCPQCGAKYSLGPRPWSFLVRALDWPVPFRAHLERAARTLALGSAAFFGMGVLGGLLTRCFLGEHMFVSIYGSASANWPQHFLDFSNVPLTLISTELSPLCTFYLSVSLTFVTRPWRSELLAAPLKPAAALFLGACIRASVNRAWLYAVRRLTGIDAVSRSQVAGIPETAHLARQLQHDDGIEIFPTSASSAGPDPPTPIAILQDRLQRLGLVREFKYIDALAPFIHILASPFVGSLFGRILEGIAGRSLWTHNLLMLASLSSDGSPAVWWRNSVGLSLWLLFADALELTWISLSLRSRKERIIVDRDFRGLDLDAVDLDFEAPSVS